MEKAIATQQLVHALELHSQGKFQDAVDVYLQILETNDDEVVRNNYGFLLLQRSELQKAMEQFDRALAFNARYAPALCNRGLVFWTENRPDDAIGSFMKALEIEPDDLQININLAQLFTVTGRYAEAEDLWQKVLSLEPDSRHLSAYVEVLLAGKRFAEAEQVLQLNNSWVEQNAKLLSFRGLISFMQYNYGEAISFFRKALGIEPENCDIRGQLANVLLKCDEKAAACLEFKRILMLEPEQNNIRNNLAVLELSDGEVDQALVNFNIVLQNDPNDSKALYYKGILLLQQGNKDEARTCLLTVLENENADYKKESEQALASISE